MFRIVSRKRSAVLAVTAAAVGLCALTVPTSAAAPPRAVRSLPAMTFDFTGLGGITKTGTGTVIDTTGATVGAVYQHCDALDSLTGKVYCTDLAVLTSGMQLSTVEAVPNTTTYPTPYEGVITGATQGAEGLTGEAHFVIRNHNQEDINFS